MVRRHSLNESFTWRPTRAPREILLDEQARQYDEQGYLLFRNAFTSEEVEEVIQGDLQNAPDRQYLVRAA